MGKMDDKKQMGIDRREFIKVLSNGCKLINYHDDETFKMFHPLIYSKDSDHPNMKLIPVCSKVSEDFLQKYREFI
ncbi:MAG: hypothetical protein GF364_19845 [Candidatus Lokiarchaeota archaeon]|nr:hypothetical protein [Candidatus Lokiarchaeota archaeon]